MKRDYRVSTAAGQTSDYNLAGFAVLIIDQLYHRFNRPISVLDVGCGSGQLMQLIEHQVQDRLGKHVGVDCSPSALKTAQQTAKYDYVLLGDVDHLPFLDKEFDLVIAFEIIEHVYKDQVIASLKEWQRVGKYLVFSTPFEKDVINHQFLRKETKESAEDQTPIYREEYLALAGAVHKSVLYCNGLAESGLRQISTDFNVWHAATNWIDLSQIQYNGINPTSLPDEDQDHREAYQSLLFDSWSLSHEINRRQLENAVGSFTKE